MDDAVGQVRHPLAARRGVQAEARQELELHVTEVAGLAQLLLDAVGEGVTASPRSADQVKAAGADEVIDHTAGEVTAAVSEPVDVLLNLAPITPEQFAALAALVRDGGVVVSTTVWMPAPADDTRGVRAIDLFVRSDAEQLSELVARVDRGELSVDVAERVPLSELTSVHARAAAGNLPGKVIVVPAAR